MAIQQPPSERFPAPLEEASTAQLVKEAFDEAKQLVRTEIELAKEEMKVELKHAQHAAIGFGVAAAASLIVLSLLGVAIVLALGGTPVAALVVAACFLVLGGIAAVIGYSLLPKRPFQHTRNRLQSDVNQLKEHIA